jgi:hypothetical protein
MTDRAHSAAKALDICVDRYPGGARFDPATLPTNLDDPWSADPRELALAWNRRWETGQTLRIRFLDGSDELHGRVIERAREWLEFANLEFEAGRFVDAEIRISFKENGYWSNVGTDALLEPDRDGPTMNFGGFTTDTDEKIFRRTVLHEFGHAIGCIHEQASPSADIPWDDAKVYAYFRRHEGWDKETTFQNVLVRYSSEQLRFTRHDPKSIMQYPVPAQLTRNGFSIAWNNELSEMDRSFIATMYPGRPVPRTSQGSKGGQRVVTRSQAMKDAEAALDQSNADTVPIDREALRSLISGPTQATSNDLWRWLVPGLLLLVMVSLVGLLWLIADGNELTSPELALTAFTALLTGLLGLFIRAPGA